MQLRIIVDIGISGHLLKRILPANSKNLTLRLGHGPKIDVHFSLKMFPLYTLLTLKSDPCYLKES